jgi:hypothetical protein
MNTKKENTRVSLSGRSDLEHELRQAEAASGIGAFALDLTTWEWAWRPTVATLFGFNNENTPASFHDWLQAVFVEDGRLLRRVPGADVSRPTALACRQGTS